MLTMGQTLQQVQQLEILAATALYQARLEMDVAKSLGIALQALDKIQKELEKLRD
jgi:predicted transcriptional regulator